MKYKFKIVNREDDFISPWERKYRVVDSKPEISLQLKARQRQQAFEWTLFWAIFPGHVFDLDAIVNRYWMYAYERPFPEGKSLEDLYYLIAEKLYNDDAEQINVNIEKYPFVPFTLLIGKERWKLVKDTVIVKSPTLTKECDMAKKKAINVTKEKDVVSKKKGKKVESVDSNDALKGKSTTNLNDPFVTKAIKFTCEKTLQRKYTDLEIRDMLEEKLDFDVEEKWVARRRRDLSKGKFSNIGFEGTDELLPKIKKVDGKVVVSEKESKGDKSLQKKKNKEPIKELAHNPIKKKLKFKIKK